MLTLASLQSLPEDLHRFKGSDFICLLDRKSHSALAFNSVLCREVIIDMSSTVVDESKEIVLVEFASLSSNVTLRMTCILHSVI